MQPMSELCVKPLASGARLSSPVVVERSSKVNAHPRDRRIKFQEEGHLYILYPDTSLATVFPISVSGLWGKYFDHFDPVATIEAYYDKWVCNPESPYYSVIWSGRECGQSDAEIADGIRRQWAEKGELASAQGTRMHRNIELALGGDVYDRDCKELCMFEDYVEQWLEPRKWCVFRLEWSIYCSEAMVAGQIDAVFVGDGEYHMVDWKRCGRRLDPMCGECFHRYGKYPFDALLDNPCSHYFVQQNLYAVILERRYGMKLRSMHLVQIHPEFETYLVVEVPDLRWQAAFILDKYAMERRRDAIDWEIAEAGG